MHSGSQLCRILSTLVSREWYGLFWFIIPYFVNHESRYEAVARVELVMLRIIALHDDLYYVNLSLHKELTEAYVLDVGIKCIRPRSLALREVPTAQT